MRGVPTDEEVVSRFRASYLFTKNSAKSSREVGIPVRTGCKLALDLADDPEFAEACRRQRALDVEEHAQARRKVRDVALKRFLSKTGGIDVKQFGEDGGVTITDKRHEYGKLVLDADKGAQALARLELEAKPVSSEARRIEIVLTDGETPPPADDPE